MTRTQLLGASAVSVLIAGGAIAATSATAAGSTHTLKLHATVLKTITTSKSTSVETDTLTKGGKKVGYETQSCNFGGQGDICSVTFALKNGALYGGTSAPITMSSTSTLSGKVTGGLGTYTGDKGTITGHVDGIRAAITIKYHS